MTFSNTIKDIKRNPRAIFALTLISISFLAAIALTASVGHRNKYWVSTVDVIAGTKITSGEIAPISLVQAGIPHDYLTASSSITGKYARTSLHKGELISARDLSGMPSISNLRSLPLKILKNFLPRSLQVGDSVDLYSLANISGQSSSSHPLPVKVLSHVKVLDLDAATATYGNEIGLVVESLDKNIVNALSQINGSNVVVVKDGE
jgi:Flp pilus assembly protein CpaB